MKNDDFEIEEIIIPEDKVDVAVLDGDIEMQKLTGEEMVEEYELDESALDYEDVPPLSPEELQDYQRKLRDLGKEAALRFLRGVNSKDVSSKDDEIVDEKSDKDEMNLSTPYFISPITNELVQLDVMDVSERIQAIYYHTGTTVKLDDKVIVAAYNEGLSSFDDFLSNLSKLDKMRIRVTLGKAWKQQLLQEYSVAWNSSISDKIDEEKEKAVDQLREDLKNEKIKSSQLGDRVDTLQGDLRVARSRNDELETKMGDMSVALHNGRKSYDALKKKADTLEQSRDSYLRQLCEEQRKTKQLTSEVTEMKASRDDYLTQLQEARAALTQQQANKYVPDFVTPGDRNVYDYIVSKDSSGGVKR